MSMIEDMEKHYNKWKDDPDMGESYSKLEYRIFSGIQNELVKEHGGVWCIGSQEYVFQFERDYDKRVKLAEDAWKITEAILKYCDGDAKKAYDNIDELYCLFRGAANE